MSEGYAHITNEMVEKLRATVGVKGHFRNPWNEEVNADAIKHWAWGMGDDNPLWQNKEYAAGTAWGTIIAPPTFLYTASRGPLGPGSAPSRGSQLPGIHGLHTGDSWEFYEVLRLGDRITHEQENVEPKEKNSSYTGRMIQRGKLTRFFNQHGVCVGQRSEHVMAIERGTPKQYNKYAEIKPWVYSDEELEMIANQYASEKPRGSEPLDWQSVQVGMELPKRLKGPLTITSMITYFAGSGALFCMTDRIAHEFIRLHPKANQPDPLTRIPDFPERAHWDEGLYKEIGFPLGYDIGVQRGAWFGHLLTDWIGDEGHIDGLTVLYREPNWMYDITWCRGRVTEAWIENGEPKVRLELWGESQRGNTHTRGEATVTLGNVTNLPR